MNQDFNVKKKQYLSEKKKIRAEGFTWKKIPAQAVSEKKKNVQAENSPKREKGFCPPEKANYFL